MKFRIIISIMLLPFLASSQDVWSKWDNNYPIIDIDTLLENERNYAILVENDTTNSPYYLRMANYRLELIYSGEKRLIADDTKQSMKNVYKTFGKPEHQSVIEKVEFEYKFEQNGLYYWFSAQAILDKSLKKELKNGKTYVLYCLFLNEHRMNKELYNSFLISEFHD